MTSSLLAGKFKFGRYCWSCPRSRLLKSPRLPRPMFLFLSSRFLMTSNTLLPTMPSAKSTPLSSEGEPCVPFRPQPSYLVPVLLYYLSQNRNLCMEEHVATEKEKGIVD